MAFQTFQNIYPGYSTQGLGNQTVYGGNQGGNQGGYGGGYGQNFYQTSAPLPSQMPTQPPQSMIVSWVRGLSAAESFRVDPGQTVMLMDSEAPEDKPVLYIVSSDSSGRPLPVDVYDLIKRDRQQQAPAFNPDEFVKRSEIEDIISAATTRAIEQKMSEIQFKATPARQNNQNQGRSDK